MRSLARNELALVEAQATTSAAAEDVWQVLADPYSYARWVHGTARIRAADPSWPAPGSRLQHTFGPRPWRVRDMTTVLQAQPPRRLVLAAHARPLGTVTAEIVLSAEPDGTRIVLRENLRTGLGALLPRAGRAVQCHRLRRSVRALAALSQHPSTASTRP